MQEQCHAYANDLCWWMVANEIHMKHRPNLHFSCWTNCGAHFAFQELKKKINKKILNKNFDDKEIVKDWRYRHGNHTQIFVVRRASTNIRHMIFRYSQIVVVRCWSNVFENHNMLIGKFDDCFWAFTSNDITKDTRFHRRHSWTKVYSIQMTSNFLQL